ncbi:MAG: HAMP domain-containing protein [Bdellovibrionales bacterium]|nr:HAMP domain-containing protein [Bdellovibrionales bacterium]
MSQKQISHGSKRHKIRNVLLLYYLLPLVVLLNASSIYFYFTAKESLDEELAERLKSIASFAAMQVKDYHLAALTTKNQNNKTYDLLKLKFEEIRSLNKMKRIYLFTKQSESLLDTRQDVVPGTIYERHQFYQSELESTQNGMPTASILFQSKDGQYFKTAFAPVMSSGEIIAYVGVDGNAGFFKNLNKLGSALTYFGLICISLVILSSILVSRKIVRPIENLVQSAEAMGAGNLTQPVKLSTDNEIGFLGNAMDEMRKKIVERDLELQMMLQGVAHEVRNPLGGIELFAGLLKEEISDPKALGHVARIHTEIQSLKLLVQEFLDFARKPSLEMNKVSLRAFFDDLKYTFLQDLEQKDLKAIFDIPEDLEALFDIYQMRRVFMNIVQNAIQASKNGGELLIKVVLKDKFLTISIKDFGQGVATDQLESIFNPFFTTKERGSGLGLAFARKIVQAHGGKIEVESEIGQGSTFYIVLPA